jgi:hypothetical protein
MTIPIPRVAHVDLLTVARRREADLHEEWSTGTRRCEFLYVDDLADAGVHICKSIRNPN